MYPPAKGLLSPEQESTASKVALALFLHTQDRYLSCTIRPEIIDDWTGLLKRWEFNEIKLAKAYLTGSLGTEDALLAGRFLPLNACLAFLVTEAQAESNPKPVTEAYRNPFAGPL